jgi:hypothetical protein
MPRDRRYGFNTDEPAQRCVCERVGDWYSGMSKRQPRGVGEHLHPSCMHSTLYADTVLSPRRLERAASHASRVAAAIAQRRRSIRRVRL